MSRLTPFDHAFAHLAEDRFPEIREEAATCRTAPDRAHFSRLPSVQRLLTEVVSQALVEEHPEAADEYLTSVFVAFRFWEAGQHVITLGRRELEATITAGRELPPPSIPYGACYLQFPERWFWAQVDPAAPHEPLDGVFVVLSEPPGELTVVAVLGLRADRNGFSQLVVQATPAHLRQAPQAVRIPPFEPVVEGGREAGLKSVVSVAELLYLAELALGQATT